MLLAARPRRHLKPPAAVGGGGLSTVDAAAINRRDARAFRWRLRDIRPGGHWPGQLPVVMLEAAGRVRRRA